MNMAMTEAILVAMEKAMRMTVILTADMGRVNHGWVWQLLLIGEFGHIKILNETSQNAIFADCRKLSAMIDNQSCVTEVFFTLNIDVELQKRDLQFVLWVHIFVQLLDFVSLEE